MIAVTYCESRPDCATHEETDEFLRDTAMFFIYQNTHVMMDMWEDHEYVNQYPHNGDVKNYFPTTSLMKDLLYGPINRISDSSFSFIELMLDHNKLTIQDDPFDW